MTTRVWGQDANLVEEEFTASAGVMMVISIVMIVIPTFAVCFRFWSRSLAPEPRLSWDDWLCLVALVAHYVFCGMSIQSSLTNVLHGTAWWKTTSALESLSMLTFGAATACALTLSMIKLSALSFYHRIFRGAGRKFRIGWSIGITLVLLWTVLAVALNPLVCKPGQIDDIGDGDDSKDGDTNGINPTDESKTTCPAIFPAFVLVSILEVLLDLYVLVLPIHVIRRLQASLLKRCQYYLALCFGYLCLILSIVRLAEVISNRNGYFSNNVQSLYDIWTPRIADWALLQTGIGIISICLPHCWTLIIRGTRHGLPGLYRRQLPPSIAQIMADTASRLPPRTGHTSLFDSTQGRPSAEPPTRSHLVSIRSSLVPTVISALSSRFGAGEDEKTPKIPPLPDISTLSSVSMLYSKEDAGKRSEA